ncbi:hypothetical protein CCACVL1_11456, partial [Corchorus capsularis]
NDSEAVEPSFCPSCFGLRTRRLFWVGYFDV